MNRILAICGTAAVMIGFGATANAQSSPANGAAALKGVENRSIQLSLGQNQAPLLNPYPRSTIGTSNISDDQFVYEQLNADTNLIVSPVKSDRELLDSVNAGDTGNNRVQVLYQPAQ